MFRPLLVVLLGLVLSPAPAQESASQNQTPAQGSASDSTAKRDSSPASKSKQSKSKPKEKPPFRWVNRLPDTVAEGLIHRTYFSEIAQAKVGYAILLPQDYEHESRRYPVVYYLHGGRPGNETKGIKIAEYLVKYRREHDLAPVIYVFNNGGPVSHYNVPAQVGVPGKPDALGADIFIKEFIPYIDRTYRTIAKREARGLEGFSQGGRGTMRLSLRYPELFASVAAGGGGFETERKISESPDSAESPNLKFAKGDNAYDLARSYVARPNAPKLNLMVYVGSKGSNYQNNLKYMEFLDRQGINYTRLIVPEATHSAKEVYDGNGLDIVQFHQANFQRP